MQNVKMIPFKVPTFDLMVYSLIDLSLFTKNSSISGLFHTLHVQKTLRAYEQKLFCSTLMCHLYSKHLTNNFHMIC